MQYMLIITADKSQTKEMKYCSLVFLFYQNNSHICHKHRILTSYTTNKCHETVLLSYFSNIITVALIFGLFWS